MRTPAALLLMIPTLLTKQVEITLVLMGSARQYETNHLPEEVEVIQAEDNLTWSDMVIDLGLGRSGLCAASVKATAPVASARSWR